MPVNLQFTIYEINDEMTVNFKFPLIHHFITVFFSFLPVYLAEEQLRSPKDSQQMYTHNTEKIRSTYDVRSCFLYVTMYLL